MIRCKLHSGESILINKQTVTYCIESTLPQYGDVKFTKVTFVDKTMKYVKHSLEEFEGLLAYSS